MDETLESTGCELKLSDIPRPEPTPPELLNPNDMGYNDRLAFYQKEQEARDYIYNLASEVGIYVGDWDFAKVFGDGHYVRTLDPIEINKKFFQEIKNTGNGITIAPHLKTLITHMMNRSYEFSVEGVKREIDTVRYEMEDKERQLIEVVKRLRSLNLYLQKSERLYPKIQDHIDKIHSDGFFKLLDVSGTKIKFVTVNNVILKDFRPQLGIRTTVDLGKFEVDYNFKLGTVYCYGYSDNKIIPDGYYHPHINTTGSICFGNAQAGANIYAAQGELFSLMMAVKYVITRYNDENPYRDIWEFTQEAFDEREEETEEEEEFEPIYERDEEDEDGDDDSGYF